ncbi:transcriptional regulator with XRE-family HTH domain [Variovorax paradoxus]|uniref:Transcriptional regulator with XRE-family HTH domain n=1 Tax=Variovorax paradoxus TaxID=34073 RepID=A0AAE3Y3M1_VARPD|nr:helix-turn-helix domain-containing protein [Variovorax paradoxus]MDP9965478.1 transcriptional regulator with XRE-family HTH domain [Variovorax paradoxus]MDR6428736.1 transcriptional regulator with XRE-family HTH domain [Variovorax paradoxus]MDR6455938.1 transcriptional regulator with XRE-family HTH domain [Variovorax paradoxus]
MNSSSVKVEAVRAADPIAPPPILVRGQGGLGQYVSQARKRQQLRIDDAANLFGVSVDLVSRLENGAGSVRLDKLQAVLDGLGLALVVGPKSDLQSFVTRQKALDDERV